MKKFIIALVCVLVGIFGIYWFITQGESDTPTTKPASEDEGIIEEFVFDVEPPSPTDSFSRRFEIETAVFSVGPKSTPEKDRLKFQATGSFEVLFEPNEEGSAKVIIQDFNEVITGVALQMGKEVIKLEPIELTTENMDLKRSTGSFNKANGILKLTLAFSSGLPTVPGFNPEKAIIFEETGKLDLETGRWTLHGLASFELNGVVFAATTLDKGGESHPSNSQLAHGLWRAIKGKFEDNMVGVVAKAQQCSCPPTCLLAAKQMLQGRIARKYILDVGLSVIEGVFSGAQKALGKAGKKIVDKVLNGIKKIKKENQVSLKGERTLLVGTVKGQKIDKQCTVKYAMTYDKASRNVTAIVHCTNCNKEKQCVIIIKFRADKDGLPGKNVSVKYLK